tara:strand:+ start:1212 stop:1667 length:456 start_codon:yes stop_codon:yes gene_type:complete
MNSYLRAFDRLEQIIKAEPFNHTVTRGKISDVDLEKQTIFPLAHLMLNNGVITNNTVQLNITMLLMDLVDVSNEAVENIFNGNSNINYIINTQLALGTRVMRVLQKASINRDDFEVEGDATFEDFDERFQNNLAGVAITFTVSVHDNMTYC